MGPDALQPSRNLLPAPNPDHVVARIEAARVVVYLLVGSDHGGEVVERGGDA